MTQETRETLTKLETAVRRMAERLDKEPGQQIAVRMWLMLADEHAAALRDVLTPRTCSTCRWARLSSDPAFPGETEVVCGHESEAHPLHWGQPVGNADTFGCTSWEARR